MHPAGRSGIACIGRERILPPAWVVTMQTAMSSMISQTRSLSLSLMDGTPAGVQTDRRPGPIVRGGLTPELHISTTHEGKRGSTDQSAKNSRIRQGSHAVASGAAGVMQVAPPPCLTR